MKSLFLVFILLAVSTQGYRYHEQDVVTRTEIEQFWADWFYAKFTAFSAPADQKCALVMENLYPLWAADAALSIFVPPGPVISVSGRDVILEVFCARSALYHLQASTFLLTQLNFQNFTGVVAGLEVEVINGDTFEGQVEEILNIYFQLERVSGSSTAGDFVIKTFNATIPAFNFPVTNVV